MQTIKRPIPNLDSDEKVMLFLRKHWIAFLGTGIILTLMLLIPLGVILYLWFLRSDILITFQFYLAIGFSIYFFSLLIFFIVSWLDWYFDYLVVTDRRLLDIHQNRLFNREIDELELLHIEDSSAQLKGILGTFFNVGDVFIQTAGTARNFSIENLPNPMEVARKIMELYHIRLHTEIGAQQVIDRHEGLGHRLKPQIGLGPLEKELAEKAQEARIRELKEGEAVKIPSKPEKRFLIKFNVHRERLTSCLEILPSLKSPTINQLADKNYLAVETVVSAEKINTLIPELKQRGAENIIETKINVL